MSTTKPLGYQDYSKALANAYGFESADAPLATSPTIVTNDTITEYVEHETEIHAVDLEEAYKDVSIQEEQLEKMDDAAITMESIADVIRGSLGKGGLALESFSYLNSVVDNTLTSVGVVDTSQVVSLESADAGSEEKSSNGALATVKDKLEKLWKFIKEQLKKVWDMNVDWAKRVMDAMPALSNRAGKLLHRANAVRANDTPKKDKIAFKSVHYLTEGANATDNVDLKDAVLEVEMLLKDTVVNKDNNWYYLMKQCEQISPKFFHDIISSGNDTTTAAVKLDDITREILYSDKSYASPMSMKPNDSLSNDDFTYLQSEPMVGGRRLVITRTKLTKDMEKHLEALRDMSFRIEAPTNVDDVIHQGELIRSDKSLPTLSVNDIKYFLKTIQQICVVDNIKRNWEIRKRKFALLNYAGAVNKGEVNDDVLGMAGVMSTTAHVMTRTWNNVNRGQNQIIAYAIEVSRHVLNYCEASLIQYEGEQRGATQGTEVSDAVMDDSKLLTHQ